MEKFAERVKAARKMRGWSLEELSSHLGLSKQALHKYENGQMVPAYDNLIHLCRVLDVDMDYFNREIVIEVEDVSFRKLDHYPVKMQETIVAQTKDFIERYLELEELLGIESKFDVKKYTRYKITSPDNVEEAAAFIREEWKLGNDPLYNVIEMLEDQHIKVFELYDDESFMGMSTLVKKQIPVIVINKSSDLPNDRKRFTALHELGHLVMNLEHLGLKEQETYCNHFAGAMLISKTKLLKEIGSEKRSKIFLSELGQLKKQYGISISGLLFRLKDCGIISQTYCFDVMNEMKRLDIFKAEPKEYNYQGEEKSNRFLQLLLRGVAMELISTSKAASLNNQKLSEFRKKLV